jgi:phosphoserine phosphatase
VRHDDAVPLDHTPRFPLTSTAPAARAVLTVSGADRPGVTARLFSALAAKPEGAPGVEVLDVEQVVVHGHLVLGVVVGSLPDGDRPAAGEADLLAHLGRLAGEVAEAVGVKVDVESASEPEPAVEPAGRPHHVIVLGRPVPPDTVAGAARAIAGIGGNIDAIRRLSDYPVTSFELTVSGAEATALRSALGSVAATTGADIAVEQVGLARRSKRLIVLDVDSTLVRGEVIDELAARAPAWPSWPACRWRCSTRSARPWSSRPAPGR